MQCPQCGKTGFVNISGKRFCSNCGARLAAPSTPAAMSDIKRSSKPLDLRPAPAAASDSPTPTPAVAAKPASQLHGHQAAGVLDLRAKTGASAVGPVAVGTGPVLADAAAQSEASAVTPAEAAKPIATTPAPTPQPTIAKVQTAPPAQPAPAGVTATTAAATQRSPLIDKFPQREPAKPALPNAVSGQVDAMQHAAASAPAPPSPPKSPALQQALAAAKQSNTSSSLLKLGSGVAAIAIMAGFVWMQNSPKLAFHNAAVEAGVEASLPTYIPSSYRQNGAASVKPGELGIDFTSPGIDQTLHIAEKRTSWDSDSLRENYVSRQTNNFLAVQGQGLTIYLYDNHATWVNHGVWYELSGVANLSREQILKVAYGL